MINEKNNVKVNEKENYYANTLEEDVEVRSTKEINQLDIEVDHSTVDYKKFVKDLYREHT